MVADIDPFAQDTDIALRIYDDKAHAPYFKNRKDIRYSNWQNFDLAKRLNKGEAEKHIENVPLPTDYISISTSPKRSWNWYIRANDNAQKNIAVIEIRILRRLGIAYGSSTQDLGFKHLNKVHGTGTLFATKHHYLVLGWIPSRSILGILSSAQFEGLFQESDISTDPEGCSKSIPPLFHLTSDSLN